MPDKKHLETTTINIYVVDRLRLLALREEWRYRSMPDVINRLLDDQRNSSESKE